MTRTPQTPEGERLARAFVAALAAINAAGFVAQWEAREGGLVVCALWWSVTRREGGIATTRPEALALTCEALAAADALPGARVGRLREIATELRAAAEAVGRALTIPPPEDTRAA